MLEYDLAVDEYLHAIVRSRPWTVRRETEQLEALSVWLYAQPDLSVELDAVTPEVTRRYAADNDLSDDERDALEATLVRLRAWTETFGLRDVRRAVALATR